MPFALHEDVAAMGAHVRQAAEGLLLVADEDERLVESPSSSVNGFTDPVAFNSRVSPTRCHERAKTVSFWCAT